MESTNPRYRIRYIDAPAGATGNSEVQQGGMPFAVGLQSGRSAGAGQNDSAPLTKADIAEIIDNRLMALKIYVVESDITEAQQAVKSVVELASF